MCRALNDAGVLTQIVNEKEIGDMCEFIDMAIVGADAIFPDGSFVNGCPTLLLGKEMSKLQTLLCPLRKLED
jgi:translation initiation factor 2B subunit (eIF-2B alpha/beta/delta family)